MSAKCQTQTSGDVRDMSVLPLITARAGIGPKSFSSFLNEIGARALGRHLGRVLEMAESLADKYENKIAQRFGFEQQLELPIAMPTPQRQEAAN